MKKKASKPKLLGSQQQQFEVILEDINGKFDFLVESTTELMKLPPKVDQLIDDMAIVKTDIEVMKGLLKRKVDLEEFEALTKRVAHLENKVRMQA